MCELCYVDEAIKGKIIARNSEFHKVASSPFGEDDEAGMLNLIDAESRTAILRRADPTKVYDLSVDHFIGMPGWTGAGDQPYQIWMTHTPQGEIVGDSMKKGREANSLVAYSGDGISMYTHCGTHIDTFNHFGYDGAIFNNFTAHDHLGSRAWRKCGAEKQPPIFARGILLDIAGMQGVATLEASHAIGEKDLVDCLKHQKTQLRSGDVVLIRTGQMNLWPDQKFVMNTPGLNREGAAFLAKSGAITIGADTHPGADAGHRSDQFLPGAHLSAGRGRRADHRNHAARRTGGRQGLGIRLLRRLHKAARGNRRPHAPGGDAAGGQPDHLGAGGFAHRRRQSFVPRGGCPRLSVEANEGRLAMRNMALTKAGRRETIQP